MQRPRHDTGFTLVEILTVVAIIATLIGLVGSAAYSARRRAYRTTAQAEAQQLATALRSWWIANRTWPSGFNADGNEHEVTRGMLKPLMGMDGKSRVAYINIPPDRFETTDENDDDAKFLDPWGEPYTVKIDPPDEIETEDATIYEGVAAFAAQNRYLYEEGVYTNGFKFSKRTWNP